MELQKIVINLQRIPLFEKLTDERGVMELYRVAKVVSEQVFNEGEWLFGQGDSSDRLYIILEGSVQLTRVGPDGVTRQVGVRGPGSYFGETGLLVGDFHDVTAAALEETQVLYITRDDFMEIYNNRSYLRRNMEIRSEVQRRTALPKFDWLREDEWVIFSEQRHWAHLVRKVAPPLLLFLFLFPVFLFLLASPSYFGKIAAILLALPLIALISLVGWQYFNWCDDYFVVTTQRVVHSERVWPVRESFEESSLENIQDIYQVRPGLVANVLNYGNLVLQTAGETVEIDMDFVANPEYLGELVSREIERSSARGVLRSRGAIRDDLAQRLDMKHKPTEEVEPVPAKTPRPNPVYVLIGWFRDYFFPPAWSVSPDGDTIVWRRFWFPGFISYMRVFLPLALLTLGGGYYILHSWNQQSTTWILIVWLLVEAVLFAVLLWFVEDWRNDYFQLTPNRLILVQRRPLLLQESRREAPLDRIQNISFEVSGIFGRIFNYGHVTLETAGTTGKFELRWLYDPQRVQSEISKQQRQYSQQQQEFEAQRRREELLSWFATYDNLRHESADPLLPPPETSVN